MLLCAVSLPLWANSKNESDLCDYPGKKFVKYIPQKIIPRGAVSPNRKVASKEDLMLILSRQYSQECDDLGRPELDLIYRLSRELGGKVVSPVDYPPSIQGFQNYLDDSMVSFHFSAEEVTLAHHTADAVSCGYSNYLLPPQCRWPSGMIQAVIAGKMREIIEDSISIRNWWRPKCYNRAVGGARRSDHMEARGFDLDFTTAEKRVQAQLYLCQLYKQKPFNLQVGIGCKTLHVGVGSPKRFPQFPKDGSRYWTYGSLSGCVIKRLPEDNCWRIYKGKKFIFDSKRKGHGAL